MITYAEMRLKKIDIPSTTMTKGKHLKGEKFISCKFILQFMLLVAASRHRQTEAKSSSTTRLYAFIVTQKSAP